METAEEHECTEQVDPTHGGLSTRKKWLVLTVGALLVILALVAAWRWHTGNVNSVLARAGLARLPESAENVMMDRQGGILDAVRVTFIRFTASQDDVLSFLQGSGIHTPGSPFRGDSGYGYIVTRSFADRLRSFLTRMLHIRQQTVKYPSWWRLEFSNPGLLRYRRVPDRPDQAIIVDCVTNAVYIRLNHR
ncbi:MAG: hypothetical protein ACYSWQ_20655 [Planctomycetota bacterium]|jgi:hypothetical protein